MQNLTMHRISAVVIRNLWRYFHNRMTIVETLFWPALDIIIWGTTSLWFAKNGTNLTTFTLVIMTALVFWEMTLRSIVTFSVGMIDEIHEKSLLTLFTTPLTIAEWVAGTIITSIIRALVSATFCTIIVGLLYTCNVLSIGWMFIPFALSLLVSGWSLGLIGAGIIIYFGHKVQALPWMLPWLAAPFSAVYYPLDVLPLWMQYISKCLPTSYVFEGMRAILFTSTMRWDLFATSLILNGIYFAGAIAFFLFMFKKSKDLGLARL